MTEQPAVNGEGGRRDERHCPAVTSEAIVQPLPGGESVCLHTGTEEYFGLNEVATRIWALLADGHPIPDIRARLLAEYDADEATLEVDLDRFVGELRQCGLITPP